MNEAIKQILDDLYLVDKDLKKHEPELIRVVDELLKARPNPGIDGKFMKELRAEIMKKAAEIKGRPVAAVSSSVGWWGLAYALGGAVLTLALVAPAADYLERLGTMPQEAALNSDAPKIARLERDAFGSLAGSGAALKDDGGAASVVRPEMATDNSVSYSTGVQSDMPLPAKMRSDAAPLGMGGGGASGLVMPPYDWVNYKYEYAGDALTSPAASLPVYKRVVTPKTSVNLLNLVKGSEMPSLDLAKFQNLKMTNFSAAEDRDYGYSLYFDFLSGMANIDMQWERWPQLGRDCQDPACYENLRLKEGDVPPDSELIRIADAFLKQYNINTDDFGAGEVRNEWRLMYAAAENKNDIWIPDTIMVVYPLKVDGRTVYDESGYANGLNVNVNVREKRVVNLNGLRTLDFESSDYAMETDAERIKRLAENGGNNWGQGIFEDAKTVTVKLGTPTIELVAYWRYNPDNGRGDELYVPAYVFPVLNKEEAPNLYRDKVVVFLSKEILDEREPQDGGFIPEPRPMPLIEKGVDDAGSGEAGSVSSEPLIMRAPETGAEGASASEPGTEFTE